MYTTWMAEIRDPFIIDADPLHRALDIQINWINYAWEAHHQLSMTVTLLQKRRLRANGRRVELSSKKGVPEKSWVIKSTNLVKKWKPTRKQKKLKSVRLDGRWRTSNFTTNSTPPSSSSPYQRCPHWVGWQWKISSGHKYHTRLEHAEQGVCWCWLSRRVLMLLALGNINLNFHFHFTIFARVEWLHYLFVRRLV